MVASRNRKRRRIPYGRNRKVRRYTTKSARYKRRGTFSERMGGGRWRTRVPRTLNPFPNTKLVRHVYHDVVTFPAGAGAGFVSKYTFRSNGMFDPDVTGGGHQPMFRDEMVSKYNYYTVIAAYLKLAFNPVDTMPQMISTTVNQDDSLAVNPSTTMEQHGYPKWIGTPGTRATAITMRASADLVKLEKTSYKAYLADDTNKVTSGNDPGSTRTWYFVNYRYPLLVTDTLAAMKCKIELIQICLWRETADFLAS